MKKIISLALTLVLLFSFAACNNGDEKNTNNSEQSTLPLDVEQLKYNWTSGILLFSDDKQITIPCTVAEFLEASGLDVNVIDINNQTLASGKSKTFFVLNEEVRVSVTCKNSSKEDIKIADATICEYSFNNTNEGNKNIKFANTLTVGTGKTAVIEALGEPKKTAGNETLYYYIGKNDKGQDVELRINFNSDNIVNSVAFKIEV